MGVRFCGFVESGVDSAELWNRWWIGVFKEREDSTFGESQK